jgi:hypothetical protein
MISQVQYVLGKQEESKKKEQVLYELDALVFVFEFI